MIFVGLQITKYAEHGFWLAASALAVPFAGFLIFKYKQRQIGIGMLVSSIPIALLAIVFVLIGKLH